MATSSPLLFFSQSTKRCCSQFWESTKSKFWTEFDCSVSCYWQATTGKLAVEWTLVIIPAEFCHWQIKMKHDEKVMSMVLVTGVLVKLYVEAVDGRITDITFSSCFILICQWQNSASIITRLGFSWVFKCDISRLEIWIEYSQPCRNS